MTNEEYHAHSAISSSNLKLGLINPQILWEREHFKMNPTPSMIFGTLVHSLVLEPETVNINDFSTRKVGDNLTIADYELAKKIAFNVMLLFGWLFTNGEAEKSYFAYYKSVEVKCRPDYLIKSHKILVDLKTIDRANDRNIDKAIKEFRYDISLAFYRLVLRLCGIEVERVYLVFAEKTGQHLVKYVELSYQTLAAAEQECIAVLEEQNNIIETIKSGKAYQFKPQPRVI